MIWFLLFVVVSITLAKNPTEEDYLKEGRDYWMNLGLGTLEKNLEAETTKTNVAKNVIIFIGDGMGISTITASRIYKGQKYLEKFGEEHQLSFERFPNVALVKTYNVDKQTPDSAATATAIFTGVKTRYKAVCVDVSVSAQSFNATSFEASKLDTVMDWAQSVGKYTGIVTTATLTDATPACTYAHSYDRYKECDADLTDADRDAFKDIARQLVEDAPGKDFKVVLGGGQSQFGYTAGVGDGCVRTDGLNLTQSWIDGRNGSNYVLAGNAEDLEKVDDSTEYLFGVFAPKHLEYELVRDNSTPSLTEMTKKALQILKKGPEGFVLMVEGAKIDKAHHENYAKMSLEETSEFDNAITYALEQTGDDTLILVTADHSHAFTINGYASRGTDILTTTYEEDDNKTYAILSYANGPGFTYHYQPDALNSSNYPWRELVNDTNRDTDPEYRQPGTWSLDSETHGGEDVALYAKGPGAHLFRGVFEQNYIAHVISYSACFGPHAELNKDCVNSAKVIVSFNILSLIAICFIIKLA